jgi:alanine dehydrogenase
VRIGIPREIKQGEYRVAATPGMVEAMVADGHAVLVEQGIDDVGYGEAGAELVSDVWDAELIFKVKEPQLSEVKKMHEGQLLFSFLHLAANRPLTEALLKKGVTAIAFETVTDDAGRLPLLTPMSEIAGRFAAQRGALLLQVIEGGKGLLLGGVPGVFPGRVVVLGAGIVGTEAARVALGLGAEVIVLDKNLERLRTFEGVETRFSTPESVREAVVSADMVVGAVLVPGGKAPQIVTREMVGAMEEGSVLVDVAIDQGGCCETSRPTSHAEPTYREEGVVHYCVTNIPGAVPKTATAALGNATLPFLLQLAGEGWEKNSHLQAGVNLHGGEIVHPGVAGI